MTYTTPSESSRGRGWMPTNARKHGRRAELPDHEDPIQLLRTDDSILLFSSVRRAHHPLQMDFRVSANRTTPLRPL